MKKRLHKAVILALGIAALGGMSGQAAAIAPVINVPVGSTAGITMLGTIPDSWDGGMAGYGTGGTPTGSTKGYAYYAPNQARVGGANPQSGTGIDRVDAEKYLGWAHNVGWYAFQVTQTGGYTVAVDRTSATTSFQPAFSLFSSGSQQWDSVGGSHSFNQVAGPGFGPGQSPLNATGNGVIGTGFMITGGADITGFVGYANSGSGFVNGDGFNVAGALATGTSDIGPLQNPSLAYNATTNKYTSVVTKGAYQNTQAGSIEAAYAGVGSSVNTADPTLDNASGGGHVDLQLWLPTGWYAIAAGGSCADFTCTPIAAVTGDAKITVLANAAVTAPVPVPAALWLLGSALGVLGFGRRRSPCPA